MSDEHNDRVAPLPIVIVGHVDHGKSTLVGRLFYETDSLPTGKLEQIQATCERRGVPFEWAFLMDALQAERDQNITIDTSQIWFSTEGRDYVIIDAPGHKEFLKNMVTGAAHAEGALLLIAANEGVQEQSRRHATMLSLLGMEQLVVVVNKMDLVGYDQQRFEAIEAEYREFLSKLGLEPRAFIPISAREGDQIASRSDRLSWYDGPTIVEALDGFHAPRPPADRALRFPIQDIYRFDERRILAGRLESGTLEVGDRLVFSPGGRTSRVRTIERWASESTGGAKAGESIGVTLEDQLFVERGHVASHAEEEPPVSRRLIANLFWLGKQDLRQGARYKLKLATQEVECQIVEIRRAIDASTLEDETGQRAEAIGCNDAAELEIETRYPLALDRVQEHTTTGRFVLVDGYDVAGGGIVTGVLPDEGAAAFAERGRATSDQHEVTPDERFRHNRHRGLLVLLRGFEDPSQAHQLAGLIERRLFERGMQACHLAHDEEFTTAQRLAAARALAEAGLVALVRGDLGDDADLQHISTIDALATEDTELLHLGQPADGALHRHVHLDPRQALEVQAADLLERVLQMALTPYEAN